MATMMRWDPFGEVLKMQRDMDRIFGRMGAGSSGAAEMSDVAWMPRIDVQRRGDDIVVQAELPGVKAEDVDVAFTDGMLTIRGERKEEQKREDEGWLVRESSYGSFERSMVLPEGVDPASITADFKDGVLMLTVPKALEAAKPKTTKISLGGTETMAESARSEMPAQAPPEVMAAPVASGMGEQQVPAQGPPMGG